MFCRALVVLSIVGVASPSHAQEINDVLLQGTSMSSDQSLGVSLGAEAGIEFTPGGLHIGGSHLYRLSDRDWFESVVGVTYGNGGKGCFRNRLGTTDCSYGATSGFGFEIGARIRREFSSYYDFEPFVTVGVHVRALAFGTDAVRGIAFPAIGALGARYPVQDGVYAVAQSTLRLGLGAYNRDLGWKPHASVGASVGMEFSL